eukprot:3292310-Rhodomonas_salina.3
MKRKGGRSWEFARGVRSHSRRPNGDGLDVVREEQIESMVDPEPFDSDPEAMRDIETSITSTHKVAAALDEPLRQTTVLRERLDPEREGERGGGEGEGTSQRRSERGREAWGGIMMGRRRCQHVHVRAGGGVPPSHASRIWMRATDTVNCNRQQTEGPQVHAAH